MKSTFHLSSPAAIFYYMTFCLFFAACSSGSKSQAGKHEIDILALTDRMSVVNRPKMLRYADSLYNAQKAKTPFITAGRYMAYSNYYDLHVLPLKALLFTDSAIAIIDKQDLEDSLWVHYFFAAHVKKAHTLFETGDYRQSIDAYFTIKEIADRPVNRCRVGVRLYDNIGLVLFRQQKFNEARRYFTEALNILNACTAGKPIFDDVAKKQELLGNLGESFAVINKPDSALHYYHMALAVIQNGRFSPEPNMDKISKQVSKGVILSDIAEIFKKENKLDSAELYLKENIDINALSYKIEIRNAQQSELSLAGLYDKEKNYPKMLGVLSELRKSLDSIRNEDVELGWRRLKAQYDAENGQSAMALADYEHYITYKDSLDNIKTLVSQSDINRELNFRRQQTDNTVLQKDNQLSHLYLIVITVFFVLVLFIVGLIYIYYRRGKNNIRTLTLLNQQIGEQKDSLSFAMVELEKSNKDKERILRIVAHDLRDPIGGAENLVNTVLNEDMTPEEEQMHLELVKKSLTNSMTLINELMEVELGANQIKLNKEPTDLNEVARQCIALMQLVASRKQQKIQLTLPSQPVIMAIDKNRVERLINNLIGNAIKFSRQGDSIFVEIEPGASAVKIKIKDNGIGIPDEMVHDVFNLFSGVRRAGTSGEKSFGLGLSICRQIAVAHGGKIWVKSEAGTGSTFYVELPR